MLIGEKVVFLRMPKASTTSTTSALKNMNVGTFIGGGVSLPMPGYRMPMHAGFSYLPDNFKKRYVFGTVRNPYPGLVSYYNYFLDEAGEGRMGFGPFIHLDTDGQPEFKGTLAKMLYPEQHGLEGKLQFIGHSDGEADLAEWMGNLGIGLWSWWYLWIYARDPVGLALGGDREEMMREHDTLVGQRAIIDSLHVQQGLPVVLDAAGVELDEEQAKVISDFPHRNVNRDNVPEEQRGKAGGRLYSGEWRSLYDDEAIGWVKDRERLLLQRYGYDERGEGFAEPVFFEQPEAEMKPYRGPLLRDFFASQQQAEEE